MLIIERFSHMARMFPVITLGFFVCLPMPALQFTAAGPTDMDSQDSMQQAVTTGDAGLPGEQITPSLEPPDVALASVPDATQTPVTKRGILVRKYAEFALNDSSGQVYLLDLPDATAKSFKGQSVLITGTLEDRTKLLHVNTIEANLYHEQSGQFTRAKATR